MGAPDITYKLRNLSTGYKRGGQVKRLAQGVEAELFRGELTCLIGVNGAGKSTLLRTLAGLQPPLEGQVELNGRELAKYSQKDLARQVSVVLTDEIAEHNLTAEELVAMGRMPYTNYWGALSAEDKQQVDLAIEMVGMNAFRNRTIGSLSDGEKQKLLIAKALCQDTDVVLLDEPVAFLDFPSKVSVLRLLSKVACESNKSVMLSIHDIELALQVAQRLWILNGQEFMVGRPAELAQEGKIDFLFDGEGICFDRQQMQYKLNV